MDQNRKPDWWKWRQMPAWKLWECVALSLNIDPINIGRNRQAWMGAEHPFADSIGFHDRLEIARRTLDEDGPLRPRSKDLVYWYNTPIAPLEFVAWASQSEWDMPAEMLSLVASQPPVSDRAIANNGAISEARSDDSSKSLSGAWPWGRYETNLLRNLAAAANKFWVNYDPADPTTAPKSADVEAFLVSQSVSARVAKYIAQILRADGLRPGPRTAENDDSDE